MCAGSRWGVQRWGIVAYFAQTWVSGIASHFRVMHLCFSPDEVCSTHHP